MLMKHEGEVPRELGQWPNECERSGWKLKDGGESILVEEEFG